MVRSQVTTPKNKKYAPKSFRNTMKSKYSDRFRTLNILKTSKAKATSPRKNILKNPESQRSPRNKKIQSSKEITQMPLNQRKKSSKKKINKKSSKNLIKHKRNSKKSLKQLSIDKKIIQNKSCKLDKSPHMKIGEKIRQLRVPPSLDKLKKLEVKGEESPELIRRKKKLFKRLQPDFLKNKAGVQEGDAEAF